MPKRTRTEFAIPGTSRTKRALYDLVVVEPVAAVAARTGIADLPSSAALPYGCSLCVAPCRDEAGHPTSAVFVMDHVRRMAFEVRPRSGAVSARSVGTRSTSSPPPPPRSNSPSASPAKASPALPPVVVSVSVPHAAHVPASRALTPPAFYEDVQLPSASSAPPPAKPVPQQAPAGAASMAAPLEVRMPVDLTEKHRNALLYCNLCKVYIPPDAVNLESHLNSRHIHQRVQDDLIAEAVKTGALINPSTGRMLSVRELAARQPKSSQRPASLMVSDKNYEAVPTFIRPQSLMTDQARDEDPSLLGFWEAGLDVVHPFCVLCEEMVSLQLLAVHKKKPKHRDRQKMEASAHVSH